MADKTNQDVQTEKEQEQKTGWEFNESDSSISFIVAEKDKKPYAETLFKFKLTRFKNSATYEESLKITNLRVNNEDGYDENGYIVTSISNLYDDIKQFKKFGVVLESTSFHKLCKEIERHYLILPEDQVRLVNDDKRFDAVIEEIEQYFLQAKGSSQSKDLIEDVFCYIPVNVFNEIVYDCGYHTYEMSALRDDLDGEYVHTRSGRFAMSKRIKEKVIRAVAFKREKFNLPLDKSNQSSENRGEGNEE